MAWELTVYFGDNRMPEGTEKTMGYVEEFATKAQANTKGQALLADGHLVTHDSITHFFPACSITHMKLEEV